MLAIFHISLICVLGFSIPTFSDNDKVLSLPLRRDYGVNHRSLFVKQLSEGEDITKQKLQFNGARYFVDYEIGGQTQSAILDTGSSDTWTFSNRATGNGFDPTKSTGGYKWVNNDFHASYGNGDASIGGTWSTDTLKISGVSVPSYPFAMLNKSMPNDFPDNRGIFAIGPESAENVRTKYPSFVRRLCDEGVIKTNSFSLYNTNDTEAMLILGGLDSSKFQNPMRFVPMDFRHLYRNHYYSIDFEFSGNNFSGGVLDTGTPFVLLPRSLADNLAQRYGAEWSDKDGCYLSVGGHSRSGIQGLDFNIGGLVVTIPGSEMFVENDGKYLFAISRSITGPFYSLNILGDPILRQLYLYFDVSNSRVGVAPLK